MTEGTKGRLGRHGMPGVGSAVVSLAAAVGLVVGVRSVAAVELPGVRTLLRLPALPHESMGLSWTSRMVTAAQLQHMALDRLTGVVVALFLAAASVALLDALVLLLEGGGARRHEVAVRAALGATPRVLTRLLLGQIRRLLTTAGALGLLLGMTAGGVLRATWPAALDTPALGAAVATLLPAVAVLLALAAMAYVGVGLGVGRAGALSRVLASGRRATADRGVAFRRRAVSAMQMGVAGAVALGSVALVVGLRHGEPVASDPGAAATSPQEEDGAATPPAAAVTFPTVAVSVRAPEDQTGGAAWQTLLARLARVPGLQAESLATPGAVAGLGIRDNATAQCGACVNGGLPAPFWGVVADHHAVAPGYFLATGTRVVAGRAFDLGDGADAPRVAVINRTFANTAFEEGDPLGHLIRLGSDLDAWYEVVGVVEDTDPAALGRDDLPRSAVYLSALQHPVARADVLLRGDEDAVAAAVEALSAAGYSPGTPLTLARLRDREAAPLRWVGRVALVLGLLTLVLAMHGGYATALQVTRRRVRELGVRRVLGADDRRIVGLVLAGSARTALFGGALAAFLGALAVAFLRKSAGGVPPLGPGAYAGVTALLVGAALLASARAARDALTVAPGVVLE